MGSIISASYNSGSFSAQNMRFMYVMLSQASGVIRRSKEKVGQERS